MNLHFRHFGNEGQAIVIIHGLFGSGDNWMMLGRELAAKGFRVFMPDMRNHGRSEWNEVHTYAALAEDIKQFVQEHCEGKAHILGHSMGGKAAMTAALLYPELFHSLVVVDIAPRGYRMHHAHIIEAMKTLPVQLENRAQVDNHLATTIPEAGVRQFLMKSLEKDETGRFRWRLNLNVLEKHLPDISAPLFSDKEVEIHTLFIRGEQSDYIRDKDLFDIKRQFPFSHVVTIPNAGHWVQAEQPALFLQTLVDWLQ